MGGGVAYSTALAAARAVEHQRMLEDAAAAKRLYQQHPPVPQPMTNCRNCAAPLPRDSVCLYCGSHH